ncbi:MAG: RsmB/NOP family class I SAM-dependent RNA methyltransferase [Bacteroidota bacterium]
MKSTSLLGHTFELFDTVERDRLPADQVVDRFFRARRYLGSTDRRFIAEAVYGMLRHRLLIHTLFQSGLQELNGHSTSANLRSSLGLYFAYLLAVEKKEVGVVTETLGSYWKVHFPSVPMERLAESLLRHYDLDLVSGSASDRLSLMYSFPKWMVEEWLARLGESETTALCTALNTPAPTTIRVNTLKTSVEECQKRLLQEGVTTERTKLSPFGLSLAKRVNVPSLQSFKDGWFEVQDEASQIVTLLLDPQPGGIVIDACAGGGGKTIELAALMKNDGKILAFDVEARRLRNLEKRAERAGVQGLKVQLVGKGFAEEEDDGLPTGQAGATKADAILIDAPCSGLGTLRRNPGNKWRVLPAFVEHISQQQGKLLDQWSPLLRPGGRLVYSTCTLLRKENEEVVESFLARHAEFKLGSSSRILSRWRLEHLSKNGYLYLYPHQHGTDGFFAAVLRRDS